MDDPKPECGGVTPERQAADGVERRETLCVSGQTECTATGDGGHQVFDGRDWQEVWIESGFAETVDQLVVGGRIGCSWRVAEIQSRQLSQPRSRRGGDQMVGRHDHMASEHDDGTRNESTGDAGGVDDGKVEGARGHLLDETHRCGAHHLLTGGQPAETLCNSGNRGRTCERNCTPTKYLRALVKASGLAEKPCRVVDQESSAGQQVAAGVGEFGTPRGSADELDAELLLQAPQPLRDRRLCHLQPGGGVPEVAFLGDGDEESQVPDEVHAFQDGTGARRRPADPPLFRIPTPSRGGGDTEKGWVCGAGQRRNVAAASARSSSGCGKMPRTTVASVQIAMPVVVRMLGFTTCGASWEGTSSKNMATMMRM